MTDHTGSARSHSAPAHSPDGKRLRIAANLHTVLDLRHVDALVRFEYEGPPLRVYRCAARLDVPPERVENLAGAFAQAACTTDCAVTRADRESVRGRTGRRHDNPRMATAA